MDELDHRYLDKAGQVVSLMRLLSKHFEGAFDRAHAILDQAADDIEEAAEHERQRSSMGDDGDGLFLCSALKFRTGDRP